MVAGILCSLYGKELIPLPKEIKHHTPARIGIHNLFYDTFVHAVFKHSENYFHITLRLLNIT